MPENLDYIRDYGHFIYLETVELGVKKRLEIQERKLEELKTIVVRGFRMNNKQLDKLVDDRDGTEAKKE